MTEYNNVRQGPVVEITEDVIVIGGHEFSPLDVLDAAQHWTRAASEREWSLKDPYGDRLMIRYSIESTEI